MKIKKQAAPTHAGVRQARQVRKVRAKQKKKNSHQRAGKKGRCISPATETLVSKGSKGRYIASGFLRQQVEGVFIYLLSQSEASPTRRELVVARMGKDEKKGRKAIYACARRPKPGAQFVFVSAFRFGGGFGDVQTPPTAWDETSRNVPNHKDPRAHCIRGAGEEKVRFYVECVNSVVHFRDQLGANISPFKRKLLLFASLAEALLFSHALLCSHPGH